MANSKKLPEHTIKVGGIQISIWNNSTGKGDFKSITITKNYKDGDSWKHTNSFKPSDVPKVQIGLNETLKYLYLKDVFKPTEKEDADKESAPF